jgi:hypothetical protein
MTEHADALIQDVIAQMEDGDDGRRHRR